ARERGPVEQDGRGPDGRDRLGKARAPRPRIRFGPRPGRDEGAGPAANRPLLRLRPVAGRQSRLHAAVAIFSEARPQSILRVAIMVKARSPNTMSEPMRRALSSLCSSV